MAIDPQAKLQPAQPPKPAHKKSAEPTMDSRLSAVQAAFPRLSPHLKNVMIRQGKKGPNDDRVLEFYPPWESRNPSPGKITLELYDKMEGPALTNALGGDLLHYLGGIDPKTSKPIDPEYFKMKRAVIAARTPGQIAMDQRVYQEAVKNEGEKRSIDDWMQQSRADAYIRGYVTPEIGGKHPDEWRTQGHYKHPDMLKAVEDIKKYVTSSAEPPTPQELRKAAQELQESFKLLRMTPVIK